MLSGIQKAMQQMLKREKCLIRTLFLSPFTIVTLAAQPALADDVDTAIENFRRAGAGDFIGDSYGYAVFPSIGKGGIGIGGAHGKGEVFVGGKSIGGSDDAFRKHNCGTLAPALEAAGVAMVPRLPCGLCRGCRSLPIECQS